LLPGMPSYIKNDIVGVNSFNQHSTDAGEWNRRILAAATKNIGNVICDTLES